MSVPETSLLLGHPSEKTSHKLKFLWNLVIPYGWPLAFALFSLILASGMVLSLGWGLRHLIDSGFRHGDMTTLNLILLWMGLAVVLLALASFGRSYYVGWVGERVITDLRQRVFDHLLTLDVSFFERTRPGELVSRITTDTTLIQVLIGSSAAVAVRNFLLLMGGLAMMMATSLKLTFLTLLIVPFVLIPILMYGKRVRHLSRLAQDCVADMGGFLEETMAGIHTCQAFGHENFDRHKFSEQTEQTFKVSVKRTYWKSLLACFVMILVFSGVSMVLWYGSQDVMRGVFQPGQLSAFIFYAIVVASSAGSFSEIIADLQRALGAFDRLRELLQTSSNLHSQHMNKKRSFPIIDQGAVEFQNVSFCYPSSSQQVILKDITLSVKAGEKIAIVGPSGAGKSTLFSLLLRFYAPQTGFVYLGKRDIQEISVQEVRSQIGLVPQDPMIFSQSLYDNILYGQPEACEADVWKAIESAHLTKVVDTLPQGVHTLLGTKGIRLSGGQKQRVAIARAILRNPSLLLLDEATSALDAESEQLIQESLDSLTKARTTMVIAHRLATILKADRIIVMNRGQIEGVGTHTELLEKEGTYRRLAALQFLDTSL